MNKFWVHGGLLLVAMIYGATYFIAKSAMTSNLNPYTLVWIRIFTGALFFNVVYLLNKNRQKIESKDFPKLIIASLSGVVINMSFYFKGLSLTTEANASVLMLTAPIFVVVLSSILQKKWPKPMVLLGIIISAIGAFFLIGGLKLEFQQSNAFGDLLIILNALSYAFYLVYIKGLLKKYNTFTLLRYTFSIALVLQFPLALPGFNFLISEGMNAGIWYAIAYVCIATTIVAYSINAYAVQKAGSNLVGAYIYLQPVFAILFTFWLTSQLITLEKAIFALSIILGLTLVSKFK